MPRSLLVSILLLFTGSTLFAEQNVEEANVVEPNPNQEIIDQGSEIHAQIAQMIKEVEQLEIQIERADGDVQAAFELQKQQKTIVMLELLFDLTNVLHEQGKLGIENAELRDVVVSYIIRTSNGVDDILDTVLGTHNDQRSTSDTLNGHKLIEFERSIAYDLDWIEELFDIKSKTVQEMERLGLSSENHRENFLNRLTPFADNLAGQIGLVEKEKEAIEDVASGEPLSSDLGLQFRALQIRNDAIVGALSAIVRHLDQNGIDSTRYRQLMLQTGAVSTDLFNPRVMIGLIRNQMTDALEWVKDNAGSFVANAFIFLAILFVFNIFAKLTNYLMQRSFDTKKVETSRLMQEMLLSLSSRGIMLVGILFALGQLGLEITALLTGLGIVGFIVGFALQDSLANFAAGIMILGYRPYDVDDIIEVGGVVGTVSKMSLVSTTVLTFDNQTLIIPNNRIWGDVIRNITLQQRRRIDMEFRVAYDENIEQVVSLISKIINDHEKTLKDPSPTVQMNELSPYAMVFVVRPWVEKSDYWPVKWELLKLIKEKLDADGIKIPTINEGVLLAP